MVAFRPPSLTKQEKSYLFDIEGENVHNFQQSFHGLTEIQGEVRNRSDGLVESGRQVHHGSSWFIVHFHSFARVQAIKPYQTQAIYVARNDSRTQCAMARTKLCRKLCLSTAAIAVTKIDLCLFPHHFNSFRVFTSLSHALSSHDVKICEMFSFHQFSPGDKREHVDIIL